MRRVRRSDSGLLNITDDDGTPDVLQGTRGDMAIGSSLMIAVSEIIALLFYFRP